MQVSVYPDGGDRMLPQLRLPEHQGCVQTGGGTVCPAAPRCCGQAFPTAENGVKGSGDLRGFFAASFLS